jgi:hypothetical protein
MSHGKGDARYEEGVLTVSASVFEPWIITAPVMSELQEHRRLWASMEMFRKRSESALALPAPFRPPMKFTTAIWAISRTSLTFPMRVSGVRPGPPP